MRLPAFALVALATAGAARAQPAGSSGPVEVCRLPVDAADALPAAPVAGRSAARLTAAPCAAAARTARFDVTYTGFPAEAEAAFQAAVDTWACRVVSSQTIRVDASWESLEATTLGSAGPYLFRNTTGAPLRDTWYPAALASAFAGRDLAPSDPDIVARFNSEFQAWHFDPSVAAPARLFDLYTVVLHEIGHGLGFIGGLAVENGAGYVGDPDEARGPYVYDRFTRDGSGTPLLDAAVYPDGSAALARALQTAVRFDGPAVRQATGGPVPLYAPSVWNEGASYSHLDEAAFAPSTPDGLMTPFLTRGETIEAPGAAVCASLADLGWTLAGDCAALVGGLPTSPSGGLTAERAGPNPFASETRVRLTSPLGGAVRVVLLDALGRRVALVADQTLPAGVPTEVVVRADGLASGVYRLWVTAEGEDLLVPLVVVR